MLTLVFVILQCLTFVCGMNGPAQWNLNWLRQADIKSTDGRAKNRPEQRIERLAFVFDKLNEITRIGSPCNACKLALMVLKTSLLQDSTCFASLFYGICNGRAPLNGMFDMFCAKMDLYDYTMNTEGFSFLPDFANALRELDPNGIDGEYLCHYMFSNACPRPATPLIDYSKYWPPLETRPNSRKRSNKTFKVLHISDIHLSANYTENAPANCLGVMCCDNYAIQAPMEPNLLSPKFGHWHCDAPQALLESAVNDSSVRTNYEFALFTGDMVDHNPVFISREETLIEEERSLKTLKSYLGNLPVYPVLGNHDSYPYSQEPPKNSPYANRTTINLDLMAHMWSDFGWVRDKSLEQVKTTHGAYAIEPLEGLKVITLNSNYWYRWNFYNYIDMEDPDPSGMLQFLIEELLNCEKRQIKAWIQAHVPPGGLPDEALPPAAAMFIAILERFSDTITGQFFGHTHLDEFSVLYSKNATERSEESALNVAWIAPSITPFTDLNPGWRYYEVDSSTFEIMDAVTVYADIEPTFGMTWGNTPDLDWKVLYSARKTYTEPLAWPETEPLNGKFWHRVAKEFLHNAEFTKYFVRRSYRDSSRAPSCIDYDCRAERYCYSVSMSPDQVAQCHEDFHAGPRAKSGKKKKGYRYRKCDHDGGRRHLRGSWSFHGIPTFPMPKPLRYFTSA